MPYDGLPIASYQTREVEPPGEVNRLLHQASHQNDGLEENARALVKDLPDQREHHTGIQISPNEVEINT